MIGINYDYSAKERMCRMDKEEVGRRIKYFREKKNWKQNELANKAGVSPTYIYQLERGLKSVTVEYLG